MREDTKPTATCSKWATHVAAVRRSVDDTAQSKDLDATEVLELLSNPSLRQAFVFATKEYQRKYLCDIVRAIGEVASQSRAVWMRRELKHVSNVCQSAERSFDYFKKEQQVQGDADAAS